MSLIEEIARPSRDCRVDLIPAISRETLEGLSEKEERDLLRLLARLGQKK